MEPEESHEAPDDLVRRFARLSTWNILTNVTAPLVGLVDAALLGHLPEIRFLAGVALASIAFDLLLWTFGFLRMATTGLVAQAIGRNDTEDIERVLQRSLVLALSAGVLVFLFRDGLGELAFGLLSGDADAESAGAEYFAARILGTPAALANLVFLGWFLGRGESRIALVMTVVANLVNLGLDAWFILGLGWAAHGAGLATAIAQWLQLAVAVAFYWSRRSGVGLDWSRIFDAERFRSMFSLQRDILIRTLCLVSAFALFTDFSARLGTDTLAANALLLKIVTFAAFFIDGAAYAVETLAGIYDGARDHARMRRLLRVAILTALGCAAVFSGGMVVAPGAVLGVLTHHADVVSLGAGLAGWLVPVLLLGSVAYILDGLFIGLTAGHTLRDAMLVSAGLVYLPAVFWALHVGSVHGLWLALTLFMLARIVTLGRAARHLPAYRETGS